MKTEELMNVKRKDAHAYGNSGKADYNRNRRGREWWNYQTVVYEKMNKCQPVTVYKITVTE
jgi:hypothetical protein